MILLRLIDWSVVDQLLLVRTVLRLKVEYVVTMSETTDTTEFLGKQLLNKSKTMPLRNSMREFIEEHETESDLKELRQETEGKDLSEIVDEEREERL